MLKYKIVWIWCKVAVRPVRVDPTLRRDQVSGEWPLAPLLDSPIIFTSICQRAIVILTTNILPSWFYLHRVWMFCKYQECVGGIIIISYGAIHLLNTQITLRRRRMSRMCKTMLNVAWPAVVNNWHGFVCRKSGPLGTPDWLRWMDKPGNRKGRGCPALPKIISLSWLQQSCKFHNRSMKQTREWKRVPCHAQISYLVELERVLEYEYEILNVFIVRWGSYFLLSFTKNDPNSFLR